MEMMKTVLKKYALEILQAVPDYDNDESVSIQYNLPEQFFVDVAHSKGWTPQIEIFKLKTTRAARDHMMNLLEEMIEELS